MSTTVAHDPFARGGYRRFTLGNSDQRERCLWCGQRRLRLYSYQWKRDGGCEVADDDGRWFCNLECHHAYYGK